MIRRGLERVSATLAGLAGPLLAPLLLDDARCPGCGGVAPRQPRQDVGLCADCRQALAPQEGAACSGCGQPLCADEAAPQTAASLCPACQDSPRPWGRLVCWGEYEGRLRELILGYKFEARLGLGRQLQECLAAAFESAAARHPELAGCDLVVPVPLHPARLMRRGFNQSRELARLLARRRGLPIRQEALLRVRRTKPQMELDRSARAENIRGAFAADAGLLAGRTALLVDDIMTTGSTLEECSRMMLAAGAAQVHVLVLCRA